MNRIAATLATLILTGTLVACSGDTGQIEVLDKQVERTTTTTSTSTSTSTTTVPLTTTTRTPVLSPADRAYATLIMELPVLARNTRDDVEELLGTVCNVIEEEGGDFYMVGSVIVASSAGSFDFDYSDAGTLLAAAIVIRCPEWAAAASEFANS